MSLAGSGRQWQAGQAAAVPVALSRQQQAGQAAAVPMALGRRGRTVISRWQDECAEPGDGTWGLCHPGAPEAEPHS